MIGSSGEFKPTTFKSKVYLLNLIGSMFEFMLLPVFATVCSSLFTSHLFSVLPFFLSQELISIIRYCLEEAEKGQMTSLSFPAIGTGNLSFPRDVVSRVLLDEIRSYSRRKTPRHLREVVIVVHPSDSQTVDVSFHFVESSMFKCLTVTAMTL